MVSSTDEAEILEQDSQLLTRNLLRIATYNISYIRGLFHEKYFSEKLVPALEMKIKKLMPMDAESRRPIDWMENGVYDALQKKYLKTLLFCICEKKEGLMIEEYAFSFSYPNTSTEEVAMNVSRTGSRKATSFTSNASEVTPDQMRSSACKIIRMLVSLMRTLDPMPEERTILMKLLYSDDVTPGNYEPPFFKGCAENEAINIWNKNPLKMEVGNVNSKHLVLALKVKSVLNPCDDNNVNSGDDGMTVDNESDEDGDFSDTEVRPSEADRYVVAPIDGKCEGQSTGTTSEDDTQDAAHEEELTTQVKEWICSKQIGTINVSDVLSNFPDRSMKMVEDIMERLLKDGVLSRATKDGYTINQTVDPKTPHIKVIIQNVSPTEGTKQNNDDLIYMKASYHALPMDYVTIDKLKGKLDGGASQNAVRKLIDKMVQDGYVKNSANKILGKTVIHSESSNRKLLEIKKILKGNDGEQLATDTNERKELLKVHKMKDGSTMGCLPSIGSDIPLTQDIQENNVSMQSGQEASAMDKVPIRTPTTVCELAVPVCSLESGVLGQKIKRPLTGGSELQFIQDKRSRKTILLSEAVDTNLVEKRSREFLTHRNEDQFAQWTNSQGLPAEFYHGPQIFNTVTWRLDGSNEVVIDGHVYSTGHHRLWHFVNGRLLDLSCLFGPRMVLYTTAVSGTFYFKVTYGPHWVTLPIDGREAWNMGFQNRHGSFEYTQCFSYMAADDKWAMLKECLGDYSKKGLCPNGHEAIPMGIEAVRDACIELSKYRGELPVSEEVRESCAVLITYICETLKLNVVFDKTILSLRRDSPIVNLGSCGHTMSPMIKRWSDWGSTRLHYLLNKIEDPTSNITMKIRKFPVEVSEEHILDAINVTPLNKLPGPPRSKARKWTAFRLDSDAHIVGGKPHYLSPFFARRWPYHQSVVNRSVGRIINPSHNLQYANDVRRRGFSSALRILNFLKK